MNWFCGDDPPGIPRDRPRWNAGTRTLSVAQTPDHGDVKPLSIFAAQLRGPDGGHASSQAALFGAGTRAAPAAVAADRLDPTPAPAVPSGASGGTLFAFRAPLRLAPGQAVTLRYAYGIAHPGRIAPLVRAYRRARDPGARSERAWAAWLPKADFGPGRRWVARELAWDAYLLRAASVYEEECGHHTITQGGYYQYSAGLNLGFRSWLHYLPPMTYADPAMAREILRYSMALQPERLGPLPYFPYGIGPLCSDANLGTSGDLDVWLLYGLEPIAAPLARHLARLALPGDPPRHLAARFHAANTSRLRRGCQAVFSRFGGGWPEVTGRPALGNFDFDFCDRRRGHDRRPGR